MKSDGEIIFTLFTWYIAAQHSRSHLVFHYLFTLYSFLYCTLLAAIPCSMGRTRVRPTPTPSWFNDELPNSAMHPEEIEGATKTNSLKVNNELLYIAGTHARKVLNVEALLPENRDYIT